MVRNTPAFLWRGVTLIACLSVIGCASGGLFQSTPDVVWRREAPPPAKSPDAANATSDTKTTSAAKTIVKAGESATIDASMGRSFGAHATPAKNPVAPSGPGFVSPWTSPFDAPTNNASGVPVAPETVGAAPGFAPPNYQGALPNFAPPEATAAPRSVGFAPASAASIAPASGSMAAAGWSVDDEGRFPAPGQVEPAPRAAAPAPLPPLSSAPPGPLDVAAAAPALPLGELLPVEELIPPEKTPAPPTRGVDLKLLLPPSASAESAASLASSTPTPSPGSVSNLEFETPATASPLGALPASPDVHPDVVVASAILPAPTPIELPRRRLLPVESEPALAPVDGSRDAASEANSRPSGLVLDTSVADRVNAPPENPPSPALSPHDVPATPDNLAAMSAAENELDLADASSGEPFTRVTIPTPEPRPTPAPIVAGAPSVAAAPTPAAVPSPAPSYPPASYPAPPEYAMDAAYGAAPPMAGPTPPMMWSQPSPGMGAPPLGHPAASMPTAVASSAAPPSAGYAPGTTSGMIGGAPPTSNAPSSIANFPGVTSSANVISPDAGKLLVGGLAFCRKVESYGVYVRFERDEFMPGQEVLLYAEVENFASELGPDGYHTVLESGCRIFDRDGEQVASRPFPKSQDVCRNRRRDFFHTYRFVLPTYLRDGDYRLQLIVQDALTGDVSVGNVPLRIRSQPRTDAPSVVASEAVTSVPR